MAIAFLPPVKSQEFPALLAQKEVDRIFLMTIFTIACIWSAAIVRGFALSSSIGSLLA